jgi:hypothetical protein
VALSLSIVEASRPEALGEAADQLRAKLTDIDTIIGGQRDAMGRLDEAWRGPAADAAADRAMRDLGRQQAVRSRLARVHSALGAGGARLSSIRTALLSIVDPLRASGWQVHGDGTAIAPPYPEIFQSLESAFTAIIKRLLDLFGKTDTATATAIDVAMTEPENLPGEDAVSYGIGPGDVPLSPKAGTDIQGGHRARSADTERLANGGDAGRGQLLRQERERGVKCRCRADRTGCRPGIGPDQPVHTRGRGVVSRSPGWYLWAQPWRQPRVRPECRAGGVARRTICRP